VVLFFRVVTQEKKNSIMCRDSSIMFPARHGYSFLLLTRDVLRLCITYHYYLFFYVSSIDFDSHSFTTIAFMRSLDTGGLGLRLALVASRGFHSIG